MRLMTMDEVAEALSINRIDIRKLIKNGDIQFIKIGNNIKISEESVNDFINRNSQNNSHEYIFEFVIEPDEDRYHAYCPSLKGCRTWGHNEEEAYKNIKEAIELYLEALIEEGDPIPGIGIIKKIEEIKPVIKVRKECLYES